MESFQQSVVLVGPISPSRKILCTVAAASVLGALTLAPASAAAGRPSLVRARLSQMGRRLIFSLRTSGPVSLAGLEPLPGPGSARYVCLELSPAGVAGARRLCLGGKEARWRLGLELVNARGEATGRETVAARLRRPEPQKLVVSLLPAAAGLAPHRYRWRVVEGTGPCRAKAPASCEQSLPASGARLFRLRPVRPVGCTGGSAGLVTNGPRERKLVALTFDDGPSEYTPRFLGVLREKGVPGTFFEIGQEMPGREATMRRILREGDEIGNHTMHHTEYPGLSAIAPASSLIESITHFEPCLFRPPGGAVYSSVIAAAAAAGMKSVTWDVDPQDWSRPGTDAIYGRIVDAAQPGSIILMHDGGGPRGETLAALPRIIDTLRARGYGFETVTQLLGERTIYRPYG